MKDLVFTELSLFNGCGFRQRKESSLAVPYSPAVPTNLYVNIQAQPDTLHKQKSSCRLRNSYVWTVVT